jgi:hypothetical protein
MNWKLKIKVIVIFTVSLLQYPAGSVLPQKDLTREEIVLITDRDVYIAGEEVYFKMNTISAASKKTVHYSDIVYLELLDRQHSPLVQKKYHIINGVSNGTFVLPLELNSEYYYLRAYTSWMKNAGPSGYAYQLLSVINPFEEIRPEALSPDTVQNNNSAVSKVLPDIEISASTNQKTYGRRQKVVLDVSIKDRLGAPLEAGLVLSVARRGLLYSGNQELFAQAEEHEVGSDIPYPPEWGGHFISGKISPGNGGGSSRGDTLLFSVVGKKTILDYSISDSEGNFKLLAKGLEGLQEIVIQNLNLGKENYQIQLDDPFSPDLLQMQLPAFHMDTSQIEEINEAVITAQLNALYSEERNPVLENDTTAMSFYGQPEKELILADYIRLPEMREVFFELIPQAQIRGKGDQTYIRVRDKQSGMFYYSDPLMLVDGIPTTGPLQISELDPLKVEKIDIVSAGYFLGILHFPGIVSVFTENGRCPLTFPDYFFRQSYDFISPYDPPPFPEYSEAEDWESHRPDYRNTLYWNPEIHTGKDGKARIEFYTSDDISDYVFTIQEVSSDGKSVSFSDTISIRNH